MNNPVNTFPGVCFLFYIDVKKVQSDVHTSSIEKFIQTIPGHSWGYISYSGQLEIKVEPFQQNHKTTVNFNIEGNDKEFKKILQQLKGEYILAFKESHDTQWQIIGTKEAGVKFQQDYLVNRIRKGRDFEIEYLGLEPHYISGGPVLPRMCTYILEPQTSSFLLGKNNKIIISLDEIEYIGSTNGGVEAFSIYTNYQYFEITHWFTTTLSEQYPTRTELVMELISAFNSTDSFNDGTFEIDFTDNILSVRIISGTYGHLGIDVRCNEDVNNLFYEVLNPNIYWETDTPIERRTGYIVPSQTVITKFQILKNQQWIDFDGEYSNHIIIEDSTDTITEWRVIKDTEILESGTVISHCKIK